MSTEQYVTSIGRRKSAIAQIKLISGNGKVVINGKDGMLYMQYNPKIFEVIQSPISLLDLSGTYDIIAKTSGGGINGQAEAIKLAVARALCKISPEQRNLLKINGFLTRNAQRKERKKYGLKKARKAPQFSKR